jgi:hypothetical protein
LPRIFFQEQIFDGGNHVQGVGYSFTIEFHDLIVEPPCFGYGCHFGLGLFIPAER